LGGPSAGFTKQLNHTIGQKNITEGIRGGKVHGITGPYAEEKRNRVEDGNSCHHMRKGEKVPICKLPSRSRRRGATHRRVEKGARPRTKRHYETSLSYLGGAWGESWRLTVKQKKHAQPRSKGAALRHKGRNLSRGGAVSSESGTGILEGKKSQLDPEQTRNGLRSRSQATQGPAKL